MEKLLCTMDIEWIRDFSNLLLLCLLSKSQSQSNSNNTNNRTVHAFIPFNCTRQTFISMADPTNNKLYSPLFRLRCIFFLSFVFFLSWCEMRDRSNVRLWWEKKSSFLFFFLSPTSCHNYTLLWLVMHFSNEH